MKSSLYNFRSIYNKSLLILFSLTFIMCTACGNGTKDNINEDNEAEISSDASGKDISSDDTASEADESDMAKKFLEGFSDIEKQSSELKNSIDNDDLSQTEYNLKTGDLYALWDNTLNNLWNVLSNTLSKDEMDDLTDEENTWIADKERLIAEAGSEVEGGSMQPMVENMKGAYLTEDRVRQLIMLLPNAADYIDVTGTEYEDGNPGINSEDSDSRSEEPFRDFLENNGDVMVAYNFSDNNVMLEYDFHPGVSFSFAELTEFLDNEETVSSAASELQIAYLNNPDRKAYILSFIYRMETIAFTQYLIMSENKGQLELNYAIDGWDRRYPSFNEYGVVYDGGSNGAGAYSSSIIVPAEDFEYKTLVDQDDNAPGWDFYDPDTEDTAEPISDIMTDVLNSGNSEFTGVVFSQVIVNGRKYYYYLSDDITQNIVDEIDSIADTYNFTFDGKDKADDAIESYADELGVTAIYKSEAYVDFNTY